MRSACLFLLTLLSVAFALTQDQIFQNDWQTVSIGVPFTSLHIGEKLLTLSELGIFSIVNVTTGGVLYRYQAEITPILPTSDFVEISDKYILNFMNYEDDSKGSFKSKLFLWNLSEPYGVIEKEFDFKSNILAVSQKDNLIYVVDERNIWVIDTESDDEITKLYLSNNTITGAKFFQSSLDNSMYATIEIDGTSYFSTLPDFKPAAFDGCIIDKLRFQQSSQNLIVCNDSEVYGFSSSGVQKLNSGKNLINENLSADSLSAKPVKSFEVLKDNILIESDEEIALFKYKSLGLLAAAKFPVPDSFSHSIYHSFHVSKNSTEIHLLQVSPDMVVNYYKNGELLWSNDQSFVAIKDFVILDLELKSSLTINELAFESSSNILLSYIRRVRHNYNSFFGKLKTDLDEAHRFGMKKYIIALSENGKIGVFAMYKNEKGDSQLEKIFVPPIQFTKLYEIDKKIYALHDKTIYLVDLEGEILRQSDEFLSSHFKVFQISDSETHFVQTSAQEFYTTSLSLESNTIQGHFWDNVQVDTWKFSPENEKILSLTKRNYGNDKVAQNAIVLPDRSSLYKYLVPNVGVVTTRKVTEDSDFIVFYLINLITGQQYGRLEKEISKLTTNKAVHVAFEENFIVFTVPDRTSLLDTQICSIDLFEVLKPDQRLTKDSSLISAFDEPILPAFASQCFLLPGTSIRGLSVSRTRHNIATKDILLRTNLGRVIAFPKMIVDGRRNGIIGDFKSIINSENSSVLIDDAKASSPLLKISSSKYSGSIASKFTYDPIININPQAILTHHRKLIVNNDGFSTLITEPTELESTTYVLSIDGDIFVTFLRPSSSFDRLTSSFNTKVVIATIIFLFLGILIVRPKTQRAKLLGRWAL